MKKTILTVLMALMLVIPAYAAESGDDPIVDQANQQEQDKEPVVVASLDELQVAIDAAEDGDIIILTANDIHIPNGITLGRGDKHVTLQLSPEYANVFEFGSVLVLEAGENETFIQNITFDGNEIPSCSIVHAWCNMSIDNCCFINCNSINDSSIITMYQTKTTITNSGFYNVHAVNAGLAYVGTEEYLEVSNCVFEELSGNLCDLIQNTGTTVLNANHYKSNTFSESGHMIRNEGTLYIETDSDNYTQYYGYAPKGWYIDTLLDGSGFIFLETWEPVESFCIDQYVCLTFNSERITIESGDDGDGEDTTPEGEGTDNPDKEDQDIPQEPTQPPQEGNEDNTTDTTPQPPEQPQNPSDGDNSNNDNYTPPADYRPSQRPIWPVVTVKPTGDNKPQDQPNDTPTPAKPQLACNGAAIDTSRTVVLLGYGDGLIHEDDPLTRAQLATIVYRLLDDNSIIKYSNSPLAFSDVAADAWYAPYVGLIQTVGIVNGVGDGKYDPNGTVTWAQIITILTRFVEPQDYTLQHIQYSGWAKQAIQTAVARGWIEDRADFIPDAVISRGELEQLINSVLELYRA